MDHIRSQPTPFVTFIADHITEFTLVDVGCSGGIDPAWRQFGSRLRAYAFDGVAAEIDRLRAAETSANVSYHAGFVQGERPDAIWWIRNPTERVSYVRSMRIRDGQTYELPGATEPTRVRAAISSGESDESLSDRPWHELRLARDQIALPAFFREHGVVDVDFVKIDVDGPDFEILKTLEETFRVRRVLGAQLEVNFFGSEEPDHHTFHNTDRFMRACGFELFKLSTIPYSSAALPSPYQWRTPGPTRSGRLLCGDAVYLRDFGWRMAVADPADYPAKKHAKLAALFALYDLPDLAAEVLLRSHALLSGLFDVDHALDLLVAQTGAACDYEEYITRFEAGSPEFFARD